MKKNVDAKSLLGDIAHDIFSAITSKKRQKSTPGYALAKFTIDYMFKVKKWVIFETDKDGGFVITSRDKFRKYIPTIFKPPLYKKVTLTHADITEMHEQYKLCVESIAAALDDGSIVRPLMSAYDSHWMMKTFYQIRL